MSKNIIVLQHIPIETPGYLLDLMKKDYSKHVLVMMSSGTFGGLDWKSLKSRILKF